MFVLVSGIQHSDSDIYFIYKCMYIYFIRLFSFISYYKILSLFLCAVQ